VVAELVHRHRPPAADWLAAASGWSYPSGHTIQAVTAYGLLVVLLTEGRTARAKTAAASAVALVVILVAVSRVYLGVHWLSDVLGSISLGLLVLALWLVARLTVFASNEGRDRTSAPDPGDKRH
jgi:membrane-associated phospholipid phosphatase